MAHRSFKGISAAARLVVQQRNSDRLRQRRRRRRRRRRAGTAAGARTPDRPATGPAPRGRPGSALRMRCLLDRLAAALAPAPDDDKVVAAGPAVAVREVIRRFWPLARPFRKPFAAGVVLAALLPAVEAAEIWLFKLVVDDVLVAEALGPLAVLVPAMVGLALLGALLSFGDEYAATWVGERFTLALRTQALRPPPAARAGRARPPPPRRRAGPAHRRRARDRDAAAVRRRRARPGRRAAPVLRRRAVPALVEARARLARRRAASSTSPRAASRAWPAAPRASAAAAAAR